MDKFAALIDDLGVLIGVPLHPDSKRACRINVDNHLHLQIQDQSEKDRILIAAFIGDTPAGRFRETLFKEALKENSLFPRLGTFAYSERNNKLAFFSHVYYPDLHGGNLADFLEMFIEKCLQWKKGLETGSLPQRGEVAKKR